MQAHTQYAYNRLHEASTKALIDKIKSTQSAL